VSFPRALNISKRGYHVQTIEVEAHGVRRERRRAPVMKVRLACMALIAACPLMLMLPPATKAMLDPLWASFLAAVMKAGGSTAS
jgi:hypothetical protein